MAASLRGYGRDTRIPRCRDAALLDGGVARLAGFGRHVGWACHNVHDPPGVLHLRDARNFVVGAGIKCSSVPTARHTQRHRVPVGRTRFLPNRLHVWDAIVVDGGGCVGVWVLRSGNPLAHPNRQRR